MFEAYLLLHKIKEEGMVVGLCDDGDSKVICTIHMSRSLDSMRGSKRRWWWLLRQERGR